MSPFSRRRSRLVPTLQLGSLALAWLDPQAFVVDGFMSRKAFEPHKKVFSGPSQRLFYLQGGNQEPQNEWGIPYSTSLPPLSTQPPRKELPNGGKITLLGSGPGDPELLTVAAYKLLSNPPANALVVADRLVSKEIIDLIPCEVKIARKLPGCAELAQEELYWWCYQALKEGRPVIRLKIGDPFVFGRGGEEVLTFREFGVESTVIPVSYSIVQGCFDEFRVIGSNSNAVYRVFLPHSRPRYSATFL